MENSRPYFQMRSRVFSLDMQLLFIFSINISFRMYLKDTERNFITHIPIIWMLMVYDQDTKLQDYTMYKW